MRFLRAALFAIPLIGLSVSQSGCLLAAVGAGAGAGALYVKGKSVDVVDARPRAVADATEAAFKDLGIAKISREDQESEVTVVGRTERDTRIQVTARAETEKTTKIFIRVGVFGDDPLQARVLERINANLVTVEPTTSEGSPQ